jgi:hypothetical protein
LRCGNLTLRSLGLNYIDRRSKLPDAVSRMNAVRLLGAEDGNLAIRLGQANRQQTFNPSVRDLAIVMLAMAPKRQCEAVLSV